MINPGITVIVAVYKAEAYLYRCMESLLGQTFRDFEILLVDDGSPDCSGRICDEYAKQDGRIRIFHKEHGGVSSARQCAIDNALGEYTIHVDPDDWVEPEMLEKLYEKAKEEDADMVFCDFYMEYENKTVCKHQKPISLAPFKILSDFIITNRIKHLLGNQLIRLACYRNYRIIFPEDMAQAEDDCVTIQFLCRIKKISYLPKAFYHYDRYSNPNSLTKRKKGKDIIISVWDNLHNHCKDDLYRTSPRIYNAWLTVTAYDYFIKNLLTASEWQKRYRSKAVNFLRARVSLKIKFFTVLSALGYKDIAYRIYLRLKRITKRDENSYTFIRK